MIAVSALSTTSAAEATDEVKARQLKTIKHDRDVIRFWQNHRKVYFGNWEFARRHFKYHRSELRWTLRELREARHKATITITYTTTPHYSEFLCIHRYEGDWSANTGNGYYGGLQMDYSFMRTYGSEYLSRYGTADRWPPAVQILVAERAYASGRGFYPWPKTAHICGLI